MESGIIDENSFLSFYFVATCLVLFIGGYIFAISIDLFQGGPVKRHRNGIPYMKDPPPPPPPLREWICQVSDDDPIKELISQLKMEKYRIKQVADDCFIVERQVFIADQSYWSALGESPVSPEPIEHPSLESARKWIADQSKYPIYHNAEPDRPYENLQTK